ncbi:ergothioneine biosynthesis protein EgtC [Actinophytocola glycyrrhizae]|uniref:Gamma-glutamyl-hercynylcysteine sulfoxide hydrolase n=1 Tax=Actinophytocola glycyrrhizae TaxID=2044873 RepID=A0ABV9SES8_9PSEU
MCRHLAYVGEPVRLADLLLTPPHSLLAQSWSPRDMRGGGTVNADGYGIGWYTGEPEPVRVRRPAAMWTDAALPGLAGSVITGGVLAAVRSATIGMPVVETACAPFVGGRWLFSHNGLVRGWPSAVAALASRLPVTDLLLMDAPTDSALLWLLVRARLSAGVAPEKAVASVVTEVAEAAPGSRLNLLLTDGSTVVGTAWTHALWVRSLPGAVVVASEPYDEDPGWHEVPDGHLVTATPSNVDIMRLGDP